METQGILIGLAQMSVGLIGFTGLVVAFRRHDDDWRPDVRFWALITIASGSLAFSVLPLPFLEFELSLFTTWSICSAIFAVFLAASATGIMRNVIHRRVKGEYYKHHISVVLVVSHFLMAFTLVLNSFGVFWTPAFGPYLACLALYMVAAALLFIRMVYISAYIRR